MLLRVRSVASSVSLRAGGRLANPTGSSPCCRTPPLVRVRPGDRVDPYAMVMRRRRVGLFASALLLKGDCDDAVFTLAASSRLGLSAR